MKKVLILNGHQYYDVVAKGDLTNHYIDCANKFFEENGFEVKQTHIEKGYTIQEEVEKFKWADYILFQYPVYWMSLPWIAKKYIDETFTQGVHYASDGRSRSDASKLYGSGGLMQGKKYMLSLTWNAPIDAFTEADQFFEGVGVDGVYLPFHKANQFLGMQSLPTFIVNDVIKAPEVEAYMAQYREHLTQVFA